MTSNIAPWTRGLLGLAVISGVVLISARGWSKDVRPRTAAVQTWPAGFDAPGPVRSILARACLDCHSQETVWPWYSHVPPISWQVHEDVEKAREFMNFSGWDGYTPDERRFF